MKSTQPASTCILLTVCVLLVWLTAGNVLRQALTANLAFVDLSHVLGQAGQTDAEEQAERLSRSQERFRESRSRSALFSPNIQRGLGLAAFYAGDDAGALAAFRRGGLTAGDVLAFGHGAATLAQSKDVTRWYALATQFDPTLRDGWYHLGLQQLDTGQTADARTAFAAGAEASRSLDVGASDVYFGLAEAERRLNRTNEAQVGYEQALDLDDFQVRFTRVNTLDQLAAIYMQQRRYNDAIPLLEEAVQLSPTFDWPHFRLGTAYYHCCQATEAAIEQLNRGIQASPDNPWGYLLLGDIYAAEGAPDQATTLYQEALTLRPDWPAAQERMSKVDE